MTMVERIQQAMLSRGLEAAIAAMREPLDETGRNGFYEEWLNAKLEDYCRGKP